MKARCVFFGVIVTFFFVCSCGRSRAPVLSAWEEFAIGLSEIYPLPSGEHEATWVELLNFGDRPVDIGGWCLRDKSRKSYLFPDDLPPVPPEGIVLVTFQGPTSPEEDDESFDARNVVRLHCRDQAASSMFRGLINECALYTSAQRREEQMVDYVCWGKWESGRNSEAAHRVGLWFSKRSVYEAFPKPGDPPGIHQGGSIGRKDLFLKPAIDYTHQRYVEFSPERLRPSGTSVWLIYTPDAVTPGVTNKWPAPVIYGPRGGRSGEGSTSFSWRWDAHPIIMDEWRGHILVATDPDLQHLVIDKIADAIYRHVPPLEPGKYYWRVRAENDADGTPWSATTEFEIRPF